jgi:hypothetical protein
VAELSGMIRVRTVTELLQETRGDANLSLQSGRCRRPNQLGTSLETSAEERTERLRKVVAAEYSLLRH